MSKELTEFVKAALRNPMAVSTIFPTSKHLAKALIKHSGHNEESQTLELGCGSGAITKHILNQEQTTGSYIGIERDDQLVQYLKKTFPNSNLVTCSAEDLSAFAEDLSMDTIISSLPWSLFPETLQRAILSEIKRVLKPGGHFVTYMCINVMVSPNAQRALKLFNENFESVHKKELIIRNIPPAFVYKATK